MRIANVVFDAPASTLDEYARNAGGIADLYAELLGMRRRSRADVHRGADYPADEGDEADPLVLSEDVEQPNFAFEFAEGGYRPPRWPDPDHPQQIHLDISVPDLDRAGALVLGAGGQVLLEAADHRVYADCVGHPLCLYAGEATPARLARVVLDGPSPLELAVFYAQLLDMPVRVDEPDGRVEISKSNGRGLKLAFQRSDALPPAWPDPARPQQLHLDLACETEADLEATRGVLTKLGATRLPFIGGGEVYADPAGHPFCVG